MGEESKTEEMTVYMDGRPFQVNGPLPEISAGISAEQLTEATAYISTIWNGITATICNAAEGLREFFTTLAWALELRAAIHWAETYNPRLVHFYQHTKKGRIRKKYAKRIMASYREALHHVED